MKSGALALAVGFFLFAANLFAADGDLIVQGNLRIGRANPDQKLHALVSGGDCHIVSEVPTGGTYDPVFALRVQNQTL
jgi:hypothetical protein